jgi:hypothetical protein
MLQKGGPVMPLLNEQKTVEEFKKRRNRQIAVTVPLIAVMIAVLYVSDHPEAVLFGVKGLHVIYGSLAVLAAGVVFSLYNWRCPACGKYLGKGINPKFCPKCGARLQ